MISQHQASAMAPLQKIQHEGSKASYRATEQAGSHACSVNHISMGFEALTRAMLHLEHRAVEFVPRWRTVPGADADALMIIYTLRSQLTQDYKRVRKAYRSHKAAA